MKQHKVYEVVYFDHNDNLVTELYTARNKEEVFDFFNDLDQVSWVDSVELAD